MYTREYLNNFRVGADPEFCPYLPGGKVLYPSNPVSSSGEVGTDHGGDVLELRPAPTKSVYRLLLHCQELLQSPKLKPYAKAKWLAGASVKVENQDAQEFDDDGEPIGEPPLYTLGMGGHLHLEIPYIDAWGHPATPHSEKFRLMIGALDRLSQAYEALEIFPPESCEMRRREAGYGAYGSTRSGNGGVTTEYRVPPSWLYSPAVAYCALTGYKLAAINPESTYGLGTNPTLEKLRTFFGRFAGDDRDAARVVTRLARRGLKGVQGDPTCDIRTAWAAPEGVGTPLLRPQP